MVSHPKFESLCFQRCRGTQSLCLHGVCCLAEDVPTNPSTKKQSTRTVVIKGNTGSIIRQCPGECQEHLAGHLCSEWSRKRAMWSGIFLEATWAGDTLWWSFIWSLEYSRSWRVFLVRLWVPLWRLCYPENPSSPPQQHSQPCSMIRGCPVLPSWHSSLSKGGQWWEGLFCAVLCPRQHLVTMTQVQDKTLLSHHLLKEKGKRTAQSYQSTLFSSVAQSCPWTAARQASLSIINSQSLPKLIV